jgi:hypothetical protein
MVRLKEVTHTDNPQVVFDLKLFNPADSSTNNAGFEVYRSYRVPDLYGHPALPVPDMTLQYSHGLLFVQFTADPARNYVVQSSPDLISWNDLGAADEDDADGDYSFVGNVGGLPSSQYYRIMTQ